MQPTILIHECTPLFNDALLELFLGDDYIFVPFYEESPDLHGWPGSRLRQYVVCINKKKAKWHGSVKEFYDMFRRDVQVDGSVFYADSDEHVRNEALRLAATRKMAVSEDVHVRFNVAFVYLRIPGLFVSIFTCVSASLLISRSI